MSIKHYGEDKLVEALVKNLRRDTRVLAGAGEDDCAIIGKKTDALWSLLKTDAVIEGIHFKKNSPPGKIGWKAIARVVSDIAASGGVPRYALVTLAIPNHWKIPAIKKIYAGIRQAAETFSISIVGGETSRSPDTLFISITLVGSVEKKQCVTRSGGKTGDLLYVTGKLGGSIRGKHLSFCPRLKEARWLTKNFPIHAMMDLSDGLGSDLPRLAKASRVGFQIEKERLPLNRGANIAGAISDGEDYELLFAAPKTVALNLEKKWRKQFPALTLTCIGKFVSKNQTQSLTKGYDHFA